MKKIIDHKKYDEKNIEMNKVIKIQDQNASKYFYRRKKFGIISKNIW